MIYLTAKSRLVMSDFSPGYEGLLQFETHMYPSLWWTLHGLYEQCYRKYQLKLRGAGILYIDWIVVILQLIQSKKKKKKSDHNISSPLRSLHWLPIAFGIKSKILLLVYKALDSLAPQCTSDLQSLYKPDRTLWLRGATLLFMYLGHIKIWCDGMQHLCTQGMELFACWPENGCVLLKPD